MTSSIVYGPVPSRRLGRSLGINNIPPKKCSYSCVYCQLGNTSDMRIERDFYYAPEDIERLTREKVGAASEKGEKIDYIAFVADGEPTLDINLGREIETVRTAGIKTAVISNASLIWHEHVRRDLQKADLVSVKVDSVTRETWTRINRPHKALRLDAILEGLVSFARTFKGTLITETMLVRGINDYPKEIEKTAIFLGRLKPARCYVAVPTRPPAERIEPASEQTVNTAYQLFKKRLSNVECLTGYEGNHFTATGNIVDDLLSITAVHPMREDALARLLRKTGAEREIIPDLIDKGSLVELKYRGKKFYMRKLPGRRASAKAPDR